MAQNHLPKARPMANDTAPSPIAAGQMPVAREETDLPGALFGTGVPVFHPGDPVAAEVLQEDVTEHDGVGEGAERQHDRPRELAAPGEVDRGRNAEENRRAESQVPLMLHRSGLFPGGGAPVAGGGGIVAAAVGIAPTVGAAVAGRGAGRCP